MSQAASKLTTVFFDATFTWPRSLCARSDLGGDAVPRREGAGTPGPHILTDGSGGDTIYSRTENAVQRIMNATLSENGDRWSEHGPPRVSGHSFLRFQRSTQ